MTLLKGFGMLLASGALLFPIVAGAQTIQNLTVHILPNSSLDDAQVDSILADASNVLITDDDGPGGTDDFSCSVKLVRSGPVATLDSSVPNIVNDQFQLTSVHNAATFSSGTSVKVIDSINFCHGQVMPPGVVGGCSFIPGRSMIVTESASRENTRGILWAHEFGHNTGLDDLRNRFQDVMSFVLDPGARRVSLLECIAFTIGPCRGPDDPFPEPFCTPAIVQSPVQSSAIDPPVGSLRDFVHTVFVDSFPYSLIARHDSSEVQSLVPMLHDPAEQDSWANISAVLGIVGGPEIGRVLIEFIEAEPVGVAPSTVIQSKAAAIISLSYLLNKNGDPAVLQFLTARTQPGTWASSGAWVGQTAEARQAHAEGLSETAMNALALSGRPEAGQALLQAIGGLPSRQVDRNRRFMRHLAETYSRVQQEGLAAYYAAPR